MDLTRKQVIEILDLIKKQYQPFNINQQRLIYALDYAISSLKTDEAYQIMYEGGEIFTKADIVAMLTELQLEFEENTVRWYVGRVDGKSDDVVLMETINDIIQQKIDERKKHEINQLFNAKKQEENQC